MKKKQRDIIVLHESCCWQFMQHYYNYFYRRKYTFRTDYVWYWSFKNTKVQVFCWIQMLQKSEFKIQDSRFVIGKGQQTERHMFSLCRFVLKNANTALIIMWISIFRRKCTQMRSPRSILDLGNSCKWRRHDPDIKHVIGKKLNSGSGFFWKEIARM